MKVSERPSWCSFCLWLLCLALRGSPAWGQTDLPLPLPAVGPKPDIAATSTPGFPTLGHGPAGLASPPVGQAPDGSSVDQEGNITLNFFNADIKDVVKAVLGDYLKLNYEVAPGVQGAITLQTAHPLTKSQVLPVFEQAIGIAGFALISSKGLYRVVPVADASQFSGGARLNEGRVATSGYGIEIVPMRFVSAPDMQKLLSTIAPSQGIVHVDTTRNLLILEGTAEARQTLLDDIALFDANWFSKMSFAIFTPTYTDAQELAKELDQILGGTRSSLAGMVKLVPIARLNSVLAISPQKEYLDQIQAWVTRLDKPGQGSDRRIFVYHVQNGRASDLAKTLTAALQIKDSTSGREPGRPLASPGDLSGEVEAPSRPTSDSTSPGAAPTNSRSGEVDTATITADEVNNALVIRANPQEYSTITSALRELDVPPRQVFLEAAIAEVTLGNNLKYGVQYLFQPNTNNQILLTNSATSTIASALPGFTYSFLNGNSIQVILSALSDETHVDVISSPRLLVLNNQTATLEVGDKVPIATAQAISTITSGAPIVNSIQYQDTGVILKVTPRANSGGLVLMDISQEVSDVATTTSSDIDSPTIEERKITTSVAVQDGETIALGGLIQNSRQREKTGIPFLQDIPVLGNVFRTTSDASTKTELLVLITPRVVDNEQKAHAITDELRKELPLIQPMVADIK